MDQTKELLEINYIIGLANQNGSSSSTSQSQSQQLGQQHGGQNVVSSQDGGDDEDLFAFNTDMAQKVLNDYLGTMNTISSPTTIVLLVLYVPMFIFSLVGNTLVIYLFFKNQHMRRLKSLFLVNLALADEAVTVVCVPLLMGQIVFRLWIYGEFMCKVTEYVQEMTVASSIFTMAALSVDHCLTARRPRRDKRLYGRRQTTLLLISIWILSALFASPILTIRQVFHVEFEPLNVTMTYCIEEWSSHVTRQAYSAYLFVITFILPMIIIAACYAIVGRALCSSTDLPEPSRVPRSRSLTGKGFTSSTVAVIAPRGTGTGVMCPVLIAPPGSSGGSNGKGGISREPLCRQSCLFLHGRLPSGRASTEAVLSGRKAILRLLVVIVAVFVISWLPYNVISLTVDVNQDANQVRLLPFALWLGHAHSAVNPVIYWFFNRTFRHCASNVLICSILRRARRDSRSSQYV